MSLGEGIPIPILCARNLPPGGGFSLPRFLYRQNQKTLQSDTWPQESDTLWVDLGPEDKDSVQEVVRHLYQAHPKVIERLLEGHNHRPNLLVEDDAVSFMLALIPAHDADGPLRHLSFIVGQHFLVTAHLDDPSKVVDGAFEYVLKNHLMDEGVDFALYQLLDRHVVELRLLANDLDRQFEDLHRRLLTHPYANMSPDILALRKRAMAAKHILDPEGAIIELLNSKGFPYVSKKNHPYFQDVSFLMDEVVAEVQAIRDGLAEMVEAYTSLQSNEINKVMWFLTIISTLALPATTIASIYGMNFINMHELHWRYGYDYSLVMMVFISIVLLLWVRIHRRRG